MKRTLIGKILIIVGLLISLNPFLVFLIGGPVFIIGSIIYWTTSMTKKSKILWTIVPMVIWSPLMMGLFWASATIGTTIAQKRDYIIPEDFRGTIKIVESKCGKIPNVKKRRLQFEIPKNGIYFFNGKLESGYLNEKYYLKKEKGNLVELKIKSWATKDEEKDTIGIERITGVYGGSFGRFGNGEERFISKNVETNKIYDDKNQWKMDREQEETLNSLIADCKKKN